VRDGCPRPRRARRLTNSRQEWTGRRWATAPRNSRRGCVLERRTALAQAQGLARERIVQERVR
jgi:hypothetical protein